MDDVSAVSKWIMDHFVFNFLISSQNIHFEETDPDLKKAMALVET